MTDLYLSELTLDRRAMQGLRITDAYSLHRVVYSLFHDWRSDAEKFTSLPSGIVFADRGGDLRGRHVLMLSDRPPLATDIDGYGHVNSKPLPDSFFNHTRYRFQLIVNPTRRDARSHKLIPVRGREAIADWFCRRAPQNWGFTVAPASLQISRVEVQCFNNKARRPVTLAQAHLNGLLQVTDPVRFRHSVAAGIGRGRAFGCGLLQLAPFTDALFDK